MAGEEKELLRLWTEMAPSAREQLLEFARFLRERHPAPPSPDVLPDPVPSPPGETVVAAIRRLRAGYPMLNRARLLDETAALVAQHTLQGRGREEVIAELEAVFERHYQAYLRQREEG